jgi:peroxiredoxin
VLLDEQGLTSQPYALESIPQTVIIGKDGKIAKVFIGFNPTKSPRKIAQAVEKASAVN